MTSWFAKFRISAALDGGKALTPSLRQRITTSDDLRRFEESTIALDRGLKETPPTPELPHSLHSSIMRAVREGSRSTVPERRPALLRWLPAPALAALVLVGSSASAPPSRSAAGYNSDRRRPIADRARSHFGYGRSNGPYHAVRDSSADVRRTGPSGQRFGQCGAICPREHSVAPGPRKKRLAPVSRGFATISVVGCSVVFQRDSPSPPPWRPGAVLTGCAFLFLRWWRLQ